jgi:PAB-dependent poly(A)-specific ribonuclease subunit 2
MPFPAAEYASKSYQFIPSPNDNYTLASEGPLARSPKIGNEITSICFDNFHELIWTGNSSGRVSGFTVDNMKQAFSFNEIHAPIQHLDIYDDIVITVTSNSVAGFHRTGHAFFRANLPYFQDLKCIHRPSTNQNTVFIGGKQNELIIFDLESQTDLRIISDENSPASKIRSNHSNIFCSNDKGVITIRSHNGEKLSEIQAHYGPITGFDICDNKLVTAGCTIKSGYNDPFRTIPRGDPFLKVYDLRFMTAMQPISTPFPPQHVFFADSLNSGKIVLTSNFGRVWTTNINNNSATNFVHELPIYAQIQHAALSSSQQTLAVVDNQRK